MATSYCALAGCELKSVIHHHKPRCAIAASESPSTDQRPLPTADVGSRLTQVPTWEALFLWAVTQHLPWMGICPFTQWLPTRVESMFMSAVVNKHYSTGGRDAAYPGGAAWERWVLECHVFLSGSPHTYCS